MKKNVFISVFTSMLAMGCMFVSCSKDDDEENSDLTTTLTTENYKPEYGYFDGVMYYQITSEENRTIKVARGISNVVRADIPQNVIINGIKYTVASIGYGAFSYCSDLVSVIIPNSIIHIGNHAYWGCNHLKKIEMRCTDPPVIGEDVFYDTPCRIFVPTNSLEAYKTKWKELADRIRDVSSIKEQHGGETVYVEGNADSKSVSDGVLEYYLSDDSGKGELTAHVYKADEYVANVIIPKYVIYNDEKYVVNRINSSAFSHCELLESVTIPESVTEIGNSAFYGCRSLESVTIPSTITSIGLGAFLGSVLLDIYIRCTTPPWIRVGYTSDGILSSTFPMLTFNNATLHVPSGLKRTYAYDEDWGNFVHIVDDL